MINDGDSTVMAAKKKKKKKKFKKESKKVSEKRKREEEQRRLAAEAALRAEHSRLKHSSLYRTADTYSKKKAAGGSSSKKNTSLTMHMDSEDDDSDEFDGPTVKMAPRTVAAATDGTATGSDGSSWAGATSAAWIAKSQKRRNIRKSLFPRRRR